MTDPAQQTEPLVGLDSLPRDCPYDSENGLSKDEVAKRLASYGPNELPENKKSKWIVLLESFWGPMPAMIWVAIIVELAAGIANAVQGKDADSHFVDFAVLMALQMLNSIVGWHEEMKAGDAVAALKSSLAPKANVKRDGEWTVIDGCELVPGDTVVLALGGAVPADCTLLPGKPILVDQASLTGESLPVKMKEGDTAKMGSNVTAGEVEAVVTATGANTFFGKTAMLLNSVDNESNMDKLLLKILTAIVAVGLPCIVIIIIILGVRGISALTIIVLVVVLIVAIVPIANAVVCTSTLAFGSTALASDGAIVTRLAAIEELAGMDMLCSDKTGTLTLNKMVMQQICTVDGQSFDFPEEASKVKEAQDVLLYASLAAKWKESPKDALDTLTLNATKDRRAELDEYEQIDYEPFDPAIKRTAATLRGPDGNMFGCTKGAPNIVLQMCFNYHEIAEKVEALTEDFALRGIRCIGVARTVEGIDIEGEEEQWRFVGLITFLDPPRPDTADTIANAHNLGVKVKMITGDHLAIAKETCRLLGMGSSVHGTRVLPDSPEAAHANLDSLGPVCEEADGFAGVFPEHKFMIVDVLQRRGWTCGMTGDGVNDAPALKKAQVGIAVQGATDAARAAADIVLTNPGLSTIIKAIDLARLIFQRIKSYLIYRVTSSFMLGLFFVLSIAIVVPLDATGCAVLNPLPANDTGLPSRDLTLTTLLYPICRVACAKTQANLDQMAAFGGADQCPPYVLGASSDPSAWAAGLEASAYKGAAVAFPSYTFGAANADKYGCLATCEADKPNASPVDATGMPILEYFVLAILQLVFMIVLNDLCMITVAWDNVKASPRPEKWQLDQLFTLSVVMAATVTGLEFLFLWITTAALPIQGLYGDAACQSVRHWGEVFYAAGDLSSPASCGSTDMNVFRSWFSADIPQLQASQQVSLMYISISIAGMLTLMSARAHSFFWESMPGLHLIVAASLSIGLTIILGGLIKSTVIEFQGATPEGSWDYIGVAVLFNAFAFIVLDCVKVVTNIALDKFMAAASDDATTSAKQQRLMEARRENRIMLSHALSAAPPRLTAPLQLSTSDSSVEGMTPKTKSPCALPRPGAASKAVGAEADFRASRVAANPRPIDTAREVYMRSRRLDSLAAPSDSASAPISALVDPILKLTKSVAGLSNVTRRLVDLQCDKEAQRMMAELEAELEAKPDGALSQV